jgi:hypothetical protein
MRDGTINRKVAEEPMQANDLIRGDARRKTAQGSLEPRGGPLSFEPATHKSVRRKPWGDIRVRGSKPCRNLSIDTRYRDIGYRGYSTSAGISDIRAPLRSVAA